MKWVLFFLTFASIIPTVGNNPVIRQSEKIWLQPTMPAMRTVSSGQRADTTTNNSWIQVALISAGIKSVDNINSIPDGPYKTPEHGPNVKNHIFDPRKKSSLDMRKNFMVCNIFFYSGNILKSNGTSQNFLLSFFSGIGGSYDSVGNAAN
jgi:hypothetical protein